MKQMLILIGLVSVVGCASAPTSRELAAISSGYIGCEEKDIEAANWSPGMGYSNWDAACKGKRYKCTGSLGGSGCKELK